MSELHDLSALEQAAAIRRGELSPVELCEHYLARAERHGDTVGAFVTLAPDLALAQARTAERAPGAGVLHGVVVPVKDLHPVAGVRCTWGSAAFAEHVPDADDRIAAVLRAAGTVMLGKTNTPEFGMTAWTESLVAPPARTPWDLTRSAGGSSGGAAAAVAAGLAPVAHGSDGGGSVRGPASACGLVGLKPARGVVSGGPAGETVGLATSGAIARSVRDAAALLDVLSLADPGSPPPGAAPSGGYRAAAEREPGRLRIGRFRTPPLADVPLHPDVIAGYEDASGLLASLGHEVEDVAPPFTAAEAVSFGPVWSVLGGLAPVPPEREGLLMSITRWHRRNAAEIGGLEYAGSVARLQAVAYRARERLAAYDAILSPTLAQPPVAVGALRDDADPAGSFEAEKAYSPFAAAWNVLGLPAVSLPLHWTGAGLPVGMMLAARPGADADLVALAAQLEEARPWRDRRSAQGLEDALAAGVATELPSRG